MHRRARGHHLCRRHLTSAPVEGRRAGQNRADGERSHEEEQEAARLHPGRGQVCWSRRVGGLGVSGVSGVEVGGGGRRVCCSCRDQAWMLPQLSGRARLTGPDMWMLLLLRQHLYFHDGGRGLRRQDTPSVLSLSICSSPSLSLPHSLFLQKRRGFDPSFIPSCFSPFFPACSVSTKAALNPQLTFLTVSGVSVGVFGLFVFVVVSFKRLTQLLHLLAS